MLEQDTGSVAVFHHDNENATLVEGYEAPGSYRVVFNYSIPLESIIAVINQSNNCKQFTRAKCYHSLFIDVKQNNVTFTWLNDRAGQKLAFWGGGPSDGKGCSCGIHKKCAKKGIKCNCDKNDRKWRSDEGLIRKKDVLPITAINVGDTGAKDRKEQFIYTVGPLICLF